MHRRGPERHHDPQPSDRAERRPSPILAMRFCDVKLDTSKGKLARKSIPRLSAGQAPMLYNLAGDESNGAFAVKIKDKQQGLSRAGPHEENG